MLNIRRLAFLVAMVSAPLQNTAEAGWRAVQIHKSGKVQQRSELFYQGGQLRMDTGDGTTIVVDLAEGKFTFMQHGAKAYSSVTIDDLVKIRTKMIKEMKSTLR